MASHGNAGKSTAQDTEGEKVILLNPSLYLYETYQYDKNDEISLIPTGQVPENIHVDDGKQVREDIEHIPPKDEVNALILSTPEGLLIGDGQLGTGGNFMCEPKEYVAGMKQGPGKTTRIWSKSSCKCLKNTLICPLSVTGSL